MANHLIQNGCEKHAFRECNPQQKQNTVQLKN